MDSNQNQKEELLKELKNHMKEIGRCISEDLICKLTTLNSSKLKLFIKEKDIGTSHYCFKGDKIYFTNEGARLLLMLYDIDFVNFYLKNYSLY